MEVNHNSVNGVIKELEAQRTLAHTRAAQIAGHNAELIAALDAAQKRIKQLEDAATAKEAKAIHQLEQDAA